MMENGCKNGGKGMQKRGKFAAKPVYSGDSKNACPPKPEGRREKECSLCRLFPNVPLPMGSTVTPIVPVPADAAA